MVMSAQMSMMVCRLIMDRYDEGCIKDDESFLFWVGVYVHGTPDQMLMLPWYHVMSLQEYPRCPITMYSIAMDEHVYMVPSCTSVSVQIDTLQSH